MKRMLWIAVAACWISGDCETLVAADNNVATAPVASTTLTDGSFWKPRLETNRDVTVWHELEQCEITGRIKNFRIAAGEEEGYYTGLRFNDSDLHKVIEGASRILAASPDAKLDAAIDRIIASIAKAQEEDGYVYTVMQVEHDPRAPVNGVVRGERWQHERESHETYCMGHLIEAGIAHYEATGKRTLLDVAIKAADCLAENFGPGKVEMPSGHQEVEIALARLAKVTGDDKYLDLASFFLEQRGRLSKDRDRLWTSYFQDHAPVREQDEAVGHAVRAAYQYMAMADVAQATGDDAYRDVLRTLWESVAARKLYLTGGIGGGGGEGFSAEYQLPNLGAYNETCSSIANILWQQRMFQMDADAKYIDIAERCMLNSFLSGISMEGDLFFYPNKLTSTAGHARSPWFGCACCPPNVLRFLPQVPSLFYSTNEAGDAIYVNQFGSSEANVTLASGDVRLTQTSDYPWDGKVKIVLDMEKAAEFTIAIRRPGWLTKPFPSDLYSYASDLPAEETTPIITLDGQPIIGTPIKQRVEKGYAYLTWRWHPGAVIEIDMPMPIRRVVANENVESCIRRTALMRGPIVFAAEGVDNDDVVHSLLVPEDAVFRAEMREDLLNGVMTLTGDIKSVVQTESGKPELRDHKLTAIPYYAWAHRGMSPMRVWLATDPSAAWPVQAPLAYSSARIKYSGKNPWSTTTAVNDQILPISSSDDETPRFLFDKTASAPTGAGALEGEQENIELVDGVRWLQYEFPEPITLSSSAVYWVTNKEGVWAPPKAYRLFYKENDDWRPIDADVPAPRANRLQSFTFEPVTTRSIRLEAMPLENKTVGLMEWIVK